MLDESVSYIGSMKMYNLFIKTVYVQIFSIAVLEIKMKWTHCKII